MCCCFVSHVEQSDGKCRTNFNTMELEVVVEEVKYTFCRAEAQGERQKGEIKRKCQYIARIIKAAGGWRREGTQEKMNALMKKLCLIV